MWRQRIMARGTRHALAPACLVTCTPHMMDSPLTLAAAPRSRRRLWMTSRPSVPRRARASSTRAPTSRRPRKEELSAAHVSTRRAMFLREAAELIRGAHLAAMRRRELQSCLPHHAAVRPPAKPPAPRRPSPRGGGGPGRSQGCCGDLHRGSTRARRRRRALRLAEPLPGLRTRPQCLARRCAAATLPLHLQCCYSLPPAPAAARRRIRGSREHRGVPARRGPCTADARRLVPPAAPAVPLAAIHPAG